MVLVGLGLSKERRKVGESRRGGELIKLDKPADATASVHREWLLIELRSPWTVEGATFPAGALLAANFEAFLTGNRTLHVLFEPTDRTSLVAWAGTALALAWRYPPS